VRGGRKRRLQTLSKEQRAEKQLAAFERFCDHLGLKLEDFQRLILREFFLGRRELLILIPRGNGKTSLFAALALWHLLTTKAPRAYIGAASKEQAGEMFDCMVEFIEGSRLLSRRFVKRHNRIVLRGRAGFAKIVSSDGKRQHGLRPTLLLVDELHAHVNGRLYTAFKTAMGKRREVQLVVISTAGEDEAGVLFAMRERFLKSVQSGRFEEDYSEPNRRRIVRDGSGRFTLIEWACKDEDDLRNAHVLKLANPATFVTVEFLQEQIDSPGLAPWEVACYHANVWVGETDGWLPPKAWPGCKVAGLYIPDGAPVWLGVDIGYLKDCAALVAVNPYEDGDLERLAAYSKVWEPPGNGEELDLALVEAEIREWALRWNVRAIAYDPHQWVRSSQMLGDEGYLMAEFPQVNERMAPASSWAYEAIVSGRFAHDGNATLAAHVRAGAKTPTREGWRLTKRKAKRPMDALMALVMAGYLADVLHETNTSALETRGLIVLGDDDDEDY
jgi:phage terminase large subunit-like protein